MNDVFLVLLATAATLGFVHTALGVDHSLPFIALAQARRWSLGRTLAITLGCGTLHVLSSVLIAGIGLGLGTAGQRLLAIEESRGAWAAWLLVALGFAYSAVALWRSRVPSLPAQTEAAQPEPALPGPALPEPTQPSSRGLDSKRLMPALFLVFAFGPCEVLLPLLMAGGVTLDWARGLAIAAVFSAATLSTMLGLVALGFVGTSRLSAHLGSWTPRLRQHAHTLAGVTLLASGLGIRLLGL